MLRMIALNTFNCGALFTFEYIVTVHGLDEGYLRLHLFQIDGRRGFQVEIRHTFLIAINHFREALYPNFTLNVALCEEVNVALVGADTEFELFAEIELLLVLTLENVNFKSLNLDNLLEWNVFLIFPVMCVPLTLEPDDIFLEIN